MSVFLVLTVIGDDRPGLVDSLAAAIAEHDGNWLESRMAQLAGKFAGILQVSVAEPSVPALTRALQDLNRQGLHVQVELGSGENAMPPSYMLGLELIGQDRPGIVREISHSLASVGISIEELSSETRSASMSGGDLFHAAASLRVPQQVAIEELRKLLEDLADELMVDIEFEADEEED